MRNDGLVRLAEIAVADIDRILASVAGTRLALAETDEELTAMRTGIVAMKESLACEGRQADSRSGQPDVVTRPQVSEARP